MNVPDPCPYCGRLYTAVTRFVPGKDPGTAIRIRDIEDHKCPAFRDEPPLLPLDPDFVVIPPRSDADKVYALNRYRRSIR